MEINKNTSQDDMQRLYAAVVKREFLKGTPLNIKAFLRYAILFLLFPGMIFGFYVGLAVTAAFCGVLLTLVLTDNMHWGMTATLSWIAVGLVPTVFISIDTWRRAAKTRSQRMMERTPLPGTNAAKAATADRMTLKWRPKQSNGSTIRIATATVKAEADGIYAFLLCIDNYSGTRLVTDGPAGMCLVQSTGKKGEQLQALLLYRLKAGVHELCWSLQGNESPQTTLCRLN